MVLTLPPHLCPYIMQCDFTFFSSVSWGGALSQALSLAWSLHEILSLSLSPSLCMCTLSS